VHYDRSCAARARPDEETTAADRDANQLACAAYNAVDEQSNPEPRIPVSLGLTVRMQSTPRSFDGNGLLTVASRSLDANEGVALGNGAVDAATHFAPIPVAQLNPTLDGQGAFRPTAPAVLSVLLVKVKDENESQRVSHPVFAGLRILGDLWRVKACHGARDFRAHAI
jgi:hypothetical protein